VKAVGLRELKNHLIESSAVLAWLLGEDPRDAVRGVLGGAE